MMTRSPGIVGVAAYAALLWPHVLACFRAPAAHVGGGEEDKVPPGIAHCETTLRHLVDPIPWRGDVGTPARRDTP